MNAFIELVRELFPSSVSPFIAEEAKKSLKQFRKDKKFGQQSEGLGKEYDFFELSSVDILRQGDIVDSLKFHYFNEKGEQKAIQCKGILVSNTCDASRDRFLHFAPLIPISSITNKIEDTEKKENLLNDIVDNRVFRFLYLPHLCLQDHVVNFHLICSFPREIIEQRLNDKLLNKVLSLNTIGFYLLLCKLTVYFAREEILFETQREKQEHALNRTNA